MSKNKQKYQDARDLAIHLNQGLTDAAVDFAALERDLCILINGHATDRQFHAKAACEAATGAVEALLHESPDKAEPMLRRYVKHTERVKQNNDFISKLDTLRSRAADMLGRASKRARNHCEIP